MKSEGLIMNEDVTVQVYGLLFQQVKSASCNQKTFSIAVKYFIYEYVITFLSHNLLHMNFMMYNHNI